MAKNLEVSLLLDYYGELLTDRQRLIADYYFNDDLSLAEIAEIEGITRQAVRDLVRRTETQLEGFENRLHFARRLYDISEGLKRVHDDIISGVDAQKIAEKCNDMIKYIMKE